MGQPQFDAHRWAGAFVLGYMLRHLMNATMIRPSAMLPFLPLGDVEVAYQATGLMAFTVILGLAISSRAWVLWGGIGAVLLLWVWNLLYSAAGAFYSTSIFLCFVLLVSGWKGRSGPIASEDMASIARFALALLLLSAAVENLHVAMTIPSHESTFNDSGISDPSTRGIFLALVTFVGFVLLVWRAQVGAHIVAILALMMAIQQVRGFHVYFCLLPFVMWIESRRLDAWASQFPRLKVLSNPFFWTLLVFVLQPPLPSPVKPVAVILIAGLGIVAHFAWIIGLKPWRSMQDGQGGVRLGQEGLRWSLRMGLVPLALLSLIFVDSAWGTRLSPHRLLTLRVETRPRFQIQVGSLQACRELQSRWQVFGVMNLSLKILNAQAGNVIDRDRREPSCQIEFAAEHLRESIRGKICEILPLDRWPDFRWREVDRETGLATPGRCDVSERPHH
ncbi:MAG TPA: hypothetical protein PLZ57_10435 [Pseudobdellovibrionaceae bacterium]|nr:hypothetical protein [Pseudobdellovibrionaceae bacterium]